MAGILNQVGKWFEFVLGKIGVHRHEAQPVKLTSLVSCGG